MNSKAIIFLLMVLLLGTSVNLKAQRVILTDSIGDPDLKVFVTTDTIMADLYVCVVDSMKKVNKDGQWFYVSQTNMATLKIQVLSSPQKADLIICYVTDPKKAGWINPNKRFLYRKRK
jgi:hypothetical protein